MHEWAKAPAGWRTENVQTRHRSFEPFPEPRVTVEATYGLHQLRSKEIVPRDVYPVARSQKNMVDRSLASVV